MVTATVAENLEAGSEPLLETLEAVTQGNLIVTVLLGATASELFSALRMFQFFSVVSMIRINFPGHLQLFYKILILFSSLDMLDGASWYEENMNMRPTRPFSEKFDLFGTGDMNFLMNSGSIMMVSGLIVVWTLGFKLLYRCTLPYARDPYIRRVSMYAEKQMLFLYPVFKLVSEGYIDLVLPSTLGMVAILSMMDAPDIGSWFATTDDVVNSLCTFGVFIVCLVIPFFVQWLMSQGKLLRETNTYVAFYEDYNIRYGKARTFVWFDIFRRMLVISMVVVLDGYPTQ